MSSSTRLSDLATVRDHASATLLMPSRADCEDFLYGEAALLDSWRLEEWLALFVEGATYEVPLSGSGAGADSHESLFYIADDWFRLKHRIGRLLKSEAHAEWPRSVTVRHVTNVRIIDQSQDTTEVGSVFTTYRSKDDITHTFFGHHQTTLRSVDGSLRITAKRTFLGMSSLRPHGRVSIIL